MRKFSKGHHTSLNELNITPLLDLAFVLLVIFIITTPQLSNDLEMNLPSPKKDKPASPPPRINRITVEASADWHQPATRILTFEAKAGRKYVLRPVYQGRVIEATIQDESTLEIVAKTWGPKQPNPTSTAATPPAAHSAGQKNAGPQNARP